MVEAVGSTPQDAGSKMLVTADGLVDGHRRRRPRRAQGDRACASKCSLSRQPTAASRPSFVEWNLKRDVGMTCGGTVKLFFETYNHSDWRIVVFGAGHVASAVVECLGQLDCHVTCIDPRAEWLDRIPTRAAAAKDSLRRAAHARRRIAGRCVRRVHDDGPRDRSADPGRDLSPGPQVSVPGRHRQQSEARGAAEGTGGRRHPGEQAEAFHCPIGLDIGTNQPGEIAISVVAQLIQERDRWRMKIGN